MKYLTLILLIPMTKLAIVDFYRREVSLLWLIVFASGTVMVSIAMNSWLELFTRSWQNLLLVTYIGIGILVWGWIKSHKLINPVNTFIGLGDILFFLALIPLFPLKQFANILVCCNLFSLAWWQIMRLRKKVPKNIPLVATSSIVIGVTLIVNLFFE